MDYVLWPRTLTGKGAMEHRAESYTIGRSRMHPKPDDSARVLIHDDEDPVSPRWLNEIMRDFLRLTIDRS